MLTLLQPFFLWFAAAAVAPLVLHLLQRRRTVHQPFPTLRFLRAAQKRSASRIRFENLLLWLLRTLLLLLLALAFALPVIRTSQTGGWLGQAPRDVAIVMDGSYSMSYESGQGTPWSQAREAAEGLLADLAPGDRVCLFLAADSPREIVGEPTTEHATVLQMLRDLAWLPTGARLDEALRMAQRALTRDGSTREQEIYLLSDGQMRSWEGFRQVAAPAPDDPETETADDSERLALFALLAGPAHPENAWIESLAIDPPLLSAGMHAQLTLRAGRTGGRRSLPIRLMRGSEEIMRRDVQLEADSDVTVELPLADVAAGAEALTLSLPPDALAADDDFHFLLRARESLPVLVAGTETSTRFLEAALRPGDTGAEVQRIEPGELATMDLGRFDTLFLTDALPLPGQAILAVEAFARDGGVVAMFPGDRSGPADYQGWNILPAMPTGLEETGPRRKARVLRLVDRNDPLFTGFALPPGSVPTLAVNRFLTFDAIEDEASIVVDTNLDEPFLLSRPVDRGRVLLFSVSADRRWSTLPLTAFFLPVVHQVVRYGGGHAIPPAIQPAELLPADAVLDNFRAGDRIQAPSGRFLAVRERREDDTLRHTLDRVDETGVYLRHRTGAAAPEPVLAVNADRKESRLDTIAPSDLPSFTGLDELMVASDLDELRRVIDAHRRGRSLSELLLWLVLLLAAAEWWLANSTQRRRRTLSSTMVVEASGRVAKKPGEEPA